jgi:hypothetical protein
VGHPPGGALLVLGGRAAQIACMRDIFILNEILAQDKIYILVGTLLGLNMKLALNFIKIYINLEKCVIHWLNFMSDPFICIYSCGGGVKFIKHLKGGAQDIEFGNFWHRLFTK